MKLVVDITDVEPSVEADIILRIDYDESASSAAHAFEIAAELIRSLEDLDELLTQTISAQLTTALIVEDLKKSSVKIFLRNVIKKLPDEALRDGDVKKLVGHFLLKGKYAAIKWLDQTEDDPRRLEDLTDEIAYLAKQTDLRQLPDYPPTNQSRLAQPLDRFQEAKRKFKPSEALTITLGKEEYSVDLNQCWVPSERINAKDETKELKSEQDQFLVIAKPDFVGQAKWNFRHGKKSVSYNIVDEEWLESFKAGKYPLKPGDALRVRIRIVHLYDGKGDLIESSEEIIKVFSVIEDSGPEAELL